MQADVWVMSVEGGSPVRITNMPGRVMGPVWSADSRMIAFTRLVGLYQGDLDTPVEGRELGIVTLSDDYRPVGPPTMIGLPLSSDDFIAGWSLGDQIGVVLKTSVHKAIYTVPVSGGIATQVGPESSRSPSWSPDGRSIFYRDDTAVFRVPAEGGQASLVPINGLQVAGMNFDVSADGTRIVLQAKMKGGSGIRLWVVSVDGGKPVQVGYDTLSAYVPCWSPDGKWIAFSGEDESLGLIPASGGKVRQLLPPSDSCYVLGTMAWSPDGQKIAYPYLHQDSSVTISVIPFEGGDPVDLAEIQRDDYCFCVAWSPDGKHLAYPSSNETSGAIWVLPLDSGKPFKLQTGLDLEEIYHVDWSPDGEKIVFSAYWDAKTSFWLIDNFLPLSQPAEPEPPTEPESKGMTVRMVWLGDKVDGSGKVSPDGEFLPFIDWETGNLAIRWLDNAETQYLIDSGQNRDYSSYADDPIPSPDGELIAFTWYSCCHDESGADHWSGDLCLIRPDGSDLRVLVDCGHNSELYAMSFSPDGSLIAASFYDSTANNIALVSTDDGSVRVLKKLGNKVTFNPPCFSADGQYLAYDLTVEGKPDNVDIFLLAIDGSGEIPLIQHPADDQLLGWVPGSNSFLFLSNRSGNWDVWHAETENGKLVNEPRLLRRDIGNIRPLGFTQDSTFYYWAWSIYGTTLVARIDSITGRIVGSFEEALSGSNGPQYWSPDGEYVAYKSMHEATSMRYGWVTKLHVRSTSTGDDRVLASQFDWMFSGLNWSPGGRYLLVRGWNAEGFLKSGLPYCLGIIDVEENTDTIIVQNISAGSSGGAWSADGRSIYFVNYDSLINLDLTSGQQGILFKESDLHSWLSLSPDGNRLLVGARRGGCDCLFVLTISSGESKEIFRSTNCDVSQKMRWSYEWMPDGQFVLLRTSSGTSGPSTLWRIPVDGDNPEKMLYSDDQLRGLSIHPDGQQISVSRVKSEGEIWVMENFLPED